jgi:hypothetical protein
LTAIGKKPRAKPIKARPDIYRSRLTNPAG